MVTVSLTLRRSFIDSHILKLAELREPAKKISEILITRHEKYTKIRTEIVRANLKNVFYLLYRTLTTFCEFPLEASFKRNFENICGFTFRSKRRIICIRPHVFFLATLSHVVILLQSRARMFIITRAKRLQCLLAVQNVSNMRLTKEMKVIKIHQAHKNKKICERMIISSA